MTPPRQKRNIAIWFFGALGGILWGYDTGVISGALLFIHQDIPMTPLIEGFVVSGLLLGAMIGAGASGKLSDRLGRKKLILGGAIIFIIGTIGAALAVNAPMLIAFRLVIGIGVGIVSVVVPMYLSELAPKHIRGGLSSLMQLMVTTGIFIAGVTDLALTEVGGWRWMIGLGVIPAIILFFGLMTQPESPRWLLGSHRHDQEALATLVNLRGNDQAAQDEMAEIQQSIRKEEENKQPLRLTDLVTPRLRPLLVVGILLVFFQNFGGINTIIYYAPTLLTNIGFTSQGAILANVAITLVNLLMTLPAIRLIDRVGRRPLLIGGAIGMCFGMLLLGVTTVAGLTSGTGAVVVTLIGVTIFIASFAISWGPVQWVLLPELFPQRIRAGAMSICTTLNWLFNLTVAVLFPTLLAQFGAGPNFLFFALTTFLAFLFAWKLLPETKGRSLEEIEQELVFQDDSVSAGSAEASR
nr:sugar porter family MFS transporter [Psychromicrobium silvestre]